MGFSFSNYFVVDRVGRSGGLTIMWKRTIACEVMSFSSNHINVHVLERGVYAWKITCFYGFPKRHIRQESWDFFLSLAITFKLPWYVFGDFNDLLNESNKIRNHPHPQNLLEGFRAAIDDFELTLKRGCLHGNELKVHLFESRNDWTEHLVRNPGGICFHFVKMR